MKLFPLIILALLLSGCGSTREGQKHTVERYSETSTAPDGQVTTKIGQREAVENSSEKMTADFTPPSGAFSILAAVSSCFTGPVGVSIAGMVAAYASAHARATGAQSDERKADLEELWQMHLKDKANP